MFQVSSSLLVYCILKIDFQEFFASGNAHISMRRKVFQVASSSILNQITSQFLGVLRFGKRDVPMDKREIPGVLRFGKRDYMADSFDKRSEVPGVLRFGKRDVPGVLRSDHFKTSSSLPRFLFSDLESDPTWKSITQGFCSRKVCQVFSDSDGSKL